MAASLSQYAGFVLATGTDTLDEFAFTLALLLNGPLRAAGAALAVTGAMKPFEAVGYDGASSLVDSIKVGAEACPKPSDSRFA